MSRNPCVVTSTSLTASGGRLGKFRFMTTFGCQVCSSRRETMAGANASAVSQRAITSSWNRSRLWLSAMERMPKAMPCNAPATVPE